jgi:hypothetical protein
VGDVVVVSEKSFAAEVVVVEVPEFDGEVGGAGGEVAALLVVGDVVDGVYLCVRYWCVP